MILIRDKKTNYEKPATNTITKKAMYSRLSETYYLPPLLSTGVNKKYLGKVQEGNVFRVEIIVLNKFLAELKPNQVRKSLFTCKFQAYSKVDRLLREIGKPGLGFDKGLVPDGEWLYKVARFIDPWNVCLLFKAFLQPVPKTNIDSFMIELAKRGIENDLLISSGLDEDKEVREAIRELELSHHRFASRKAELDNMVIYGRQLTKQVEEDKSEMMMKLTSTTLLVYCRGERVSGEVAMSRVDPKEQELYQRYE